DGNGMPVKIVYGDNDADPSSGGVRAVYLYYDATYPGRLKELRRPSVMDGVVTTYCTENGYGGCSRTLYDYDTNTGKLAHVTQTGWTLDDAGQTTQFTYVSTRTDDTKGRLLSIDGPLENGLAADSNYDVVTFLYEESPDPMWDGFLEMTTKYYARYNAYYEYPLQMDFWGNPTKVRGFDGKVTCSQYDAARNVLITTSKSGKLFDCNVDDPSNITERYEHDSALRLTKVTHPDGTCTHYEWDAEGRLVRVKPRDDCNPASPGDRDEYVYDADGLLTEVDAYDQAGVARHKTLTSHHDSRRPARLINPVDLSKFKALTYDERGVMTRVDDEGGLGKTTYAVDPDPRRASTT